MKINQKEKKQLYMITLENQQKINKESGDKGDDDENGENSKDDLNQKQLEYFSQFELKFPNGNYIYTQQISSDEKYLAIGNPQLTIIDFQSLQKKLICQQSNQLTKVYCNAGNRILEKGDVNQEAKIIKQRSKILKFSSDNKYLYSINNQGLLNCYNVRRNFKRISSKIIYRETVNIIILKVVKNKFVFACPRDKTIKLYFIKFNKLILNMKMPFQIIGLDYNMSNTIFCSQNEHICVINRFDRKVILNQNTYKKVHELVCINNNQLLSRQQNSLTLWMVDYQNKELIINKSFTTSEIVQFSSVCNNQKFIIINWNNNVLILDKNLEIILRIPDAIRSDQIYYTQQLDSMKYLILPGGSKNVYLKLK